MYLRSLQLSRHGRRGLAHAALAITLAIFVTPSVTSAYCGVPSVANNWSMETHGLRVPVYISLAPLSSIEHTGVSKENMARFTIDAIARHNESVLSPKLYFAGFTQSDYDPSLPDPAPSRPGGITVQSMDCQVFANATLCGVNAIACGGSGYLNMMGDRAGTVTLLPIQCNNIGQSGIVWDPAQAAAGKDPISVILHEFGHNLGLQHTNQTDTECSQVEGGVPGPNPGPNEGVMRKVAGATFARVRQWRRDDIEGFAFLYSSFFVDHEAAWWPDDDFPTLPAVGTGQSLTGDLVSRAPMLSSAPWTPIQGLCTVDDQQRVVRYLVDGSGALLSTIAEVDPGIFGTTWGTPSMTLGVANNDTFEFVVWTAGEGTTATGVSVRWAIRDINGGSWSYFQGFEQLTPRVTAGYDDMTEQFVLATLTTLGEVEVSLIDLDGTLLVDRHQTGVAVSELAAPVCEGSACVVPVASTTIGGPMLGRVELSIDDGMVVLESVDFISQFDPFGRVGLSHDDPGWYRGIAGWQRFRLDEADATAAPTPNSPPKFLNGDWPLAIGSALVLSGGLRHRIATALPLECGNGIVQGVEECDDGNTMPADGCDSVCLIEPSGGGDTGTGADDIEDGGQGCECNAAADEPRASGIMIFAVLLLGLGYARGRPAGRERRSDQSNTTGSSNTLLS